MRILMCRPDYFEIAYEINPWMDIDNQVDKSKATKQWQAVYDAYRVAGVTIDLIDQVKGLPDMTFTANGGIVYGKKFIVSNHQFTERRGEEAHFEKWFRDHGYTTYRLKTHQSGEGDALFFRDTLYMGYGFRSDRKSHAEVGKILGVKTVSLRLIDPYFYDFDTAFCPVGDEAILYYPEAFDAASCEILKKLPHTIPLATKEAESFDCNSVFVKDTLFMSYINPHLQRELDKLGVNAKVFDLSEFKKSGGGIKCITLFLER